MSLSGAQLASRAAQEQQIRMQATGPDQWKILLLPPNLVGHMRLLLALAAFAAGPRPTALVLVSAALALDAVDGELARRLGQATSFGALYDVAIDNLIRGLLWTGAAAAAAGAAWAPWAAAPLVLEGVTLACTHASGGAAWKTGCFRSAPGWVTAVAQSGFHSPAGAAAMAGLFGLPLWLYARACLPAGHWAAAPGWGLALIPCRALAAAVELWLVWRRVGQLLQVDTAARLRRRGA